MNNREAYVWGWAWGRLEVALKGNYDHSGAKYGAASKRPLTGYALIRSAATQAHVVDEDVSNDLMAALGELDAPASDDGGATETPIPLHVQSTWQIGVSHARSGKPLRPAALDVATQRKIKKITQQELATKLGVNQSTVSRWEQNTEIPSEEMLKKLHDILD